MKLKPQTDFQNYDFSEIFGHFERCFENSSLKSTKRTCKDIISFFYKERGRTLAFDVITDMCEIFDCIGWTIQACWFAFPQMQIPDPQLKRFNSMWNGLDHLLRSGDDVRMASALLALHNLGPLFVRKATDSGALMKAVLSKHEKVKIYLEYASDEYQGKVILNKQQVVQVRTQFRVDLPAYVEANAYSENATTEIIKPKKSQKEADLEPGRGGVIVRVSEE